jgi:uncharacterized protein (TIGR00369 family)
VIGPNERANRDLLKWLRETCFLVRASALPMEPALPVDAQLKPQLNAAEVNALMTKAYPQLNTEAADYEAVEVFAGGCRVRLNATEKHLRPGGTVSGPSLFTLADIGGYVCVLSHAGPDALSVTTNLSINFMRKAGAGPVDGHCRILKLGKNLMVFDIDMTAGPDGDTVAHAVGTYSIPPKRAR